MENCSNNIFNNQNLFPECLRFKSISVFSFAIEVS